MRSKARLLVVDDEIMNRRLLTAQLEKSGYEVLAAGGGEEALALVEQHDFDLVLLDVMMPGLNGLEVLARLREDRGPEQLPVIMQTARDATTDIVGALNCGANDYVTKPIDFAVLAARVATHVGLKQTSEALQETHARLKAAHLTMESDLQAAALVQQSYLPSEQIDCPGLRFAWRYRPCEQLAGDILNILPLGQGAVGFYLLDVSGHGVQSALTASAVSHVLSPSADSGSVLYTPDPERGSVPSRPIDVVGRLNLRFPTSPETDQFFTILYALHDVASGTTRFTSAGHPGPVVLRRSGEASEVEVSGPPVGWFSDTSRLAEHELVLEPGDRLYLYSDGIVEAADPDREHYELERLMAVIARVGGLDLDPGLDIIMGDVEAWAQGPFDDDVSILAVEIAARPDAG